MFAKKILLKIFAKNSIFKTEGNAKISMFLEVWIRIQILPFSQKGVERTEIMLAKFFFAKNLMFKTEDNALKISMFLGLLDPDPLVRGMDPDPDPSLFS
jgi:hypothetical protein